MGACAPITIWHTGTYHGDSAGKSAATLRDVLLCTTARPIAVATIAVKTAYAPRCCAALGEEKVDAQKNTMQHLTLPVLRELENATQLQQTRPKFFRVDDFDDW